MGFVFDCVIFRIVLMVFEEGGMEIEEVVEKILEKIKKVVIDLVVGF